MNKKLKNFTFLTILLFLTTITYLPTFNNGFTNWDDHIQVTDNPDILEFSFSGIQKIFSSFYVGMYQPITTLIFTFENAVFGLNPTVFHAVSLGFHLLNVILVLWLIKLLIPKKEIVFITTSLFAVHPMFVEAIAWVSASSTLIYSFFYLAAIISYLYYLKNDKRKFLVFTLLLFLLSLLSKVMAITLPFLLILIDFYYKRKLGSKKVIIEKIPFFILSIIFGIIAIYGRKFANHFTNEFTFFDKIFIMIYQVFWYILKFFVPSELSAFYPNPKKVNGFLPIIYYISPIFIILFGFVSYRIKKHWKKILFGLFFFLIPVSLTLKIVQVGDTITADRYTYIPYIGLLIFVGFFYHYLITKKPTTKPFLIAGFSILFLFFSVVTYNRTKVWKSSRTLWADVILKNNKIALAQTNYGVTYIGEDDKKAEKHFLKSIEVDATFVIPYNNIGFLNLEKDRKKAEKYLLKAIEVDASYLYIYTNLAALYMKTDKEKAKKYIDLAVSINPNNGYVKQRIKTWNTLWLK